MQGWLPQIMAVVPEGRAHLAVLVLIVAILSTASQTHAFLVDGINDAAAMSDFEADDRNTAADQYVNLIKRYYRGWGHSSRFPWKRLPHEMCFREPCKSNRDCCYRWNICDKSAKVCVDCWYGSTCRSEQDCCSKYPYCARVWKKSREGHRYIASGKCVREL